MDDKKKKGILLGIVLENLTSSQEIINQFKVTNSGSMQKTIECSSEITRTIKILNKLAAMENIKINKHLSNKDII